MDNGAPGGHGNGLFRDAKVVMAMLQAMGVQDYEPRVLNQFLELMFRYITDVLGDARVYSEHAGKSTIDPDDVQLAIQSRVNFSFTQPPPREVLMELARVRNSLPLPPLNLKPGISLPPDSETLINPNWQVVLPSLAKRDFVEEVETDEKAHEVQGMKRSGPHEGHDQGDVPLEGDDVGGRNQSEVENRGAVGDDGRRVSFTVAAKRPKP